MRELGLGLGMVGALEGFGGLRLFVRNADACGQELGPTRFSALKINVKTSYIEDPAENDAPSPSMHAS